MKKIKDIPETDKPREKLLRRGPGALSDVELLAVILGRGTADCDVMAQAEKVLAVLFEAKKKASLDDLRKVKGMGPAKAMLISAALEFARRRIRPEGFRISFPADVVPLLRHYADRKQEHFLCVSINGANEVIATRVVTVGLVNRTQVHPREVFADAITDRAAAVIVAHNHPSGGVEPSKEDIELTRKLREAGETLGIKVLDHIIFNTNERCSFKEKDLL